MIFGRKNRGPQEVAAVGTLDEHDTATELDAQTDAELDSENDVDPADETASENAADEADEADEATGEVDADVDPRFDGPFDYSEVDLDADDVERISFGPLVVTPFPGMNLQLHGDEESEAIYAALAMYENSGLELALFAAPRSGGLSAELREDTIEEAEQAGGSAELGNGPFGPEVRRVLPVEGPEGEQLFHVSRIWLVEGPRWLLRGTLMGQAGMSEGEEPPADTFVEFFRNIVVRRDDAPRVPGELITLALPDVPIEG